MWAGALSAACCSSHPLLHFDPRRSASLRRASRDQRRLVLQKIVSIESSATTEKGKRYQER